MIRKLLLLLVVVTAHLQNTYAQGARYYGNCFYRSTTGQVVVRLALSNPTGSSTGQMRFVGMRFGFQFNPAAVQFSHYVSYMNFGSPGTGLDDASYLSFIEGDSGPTPNNEIPSSRTATVDQSPLPNTTKTMEMRYINRSTSVCANAITINPGETKILLDIVFNLVNNNPAYYHLNTPDYGFGDDEFIAQFFTKQDGHNGVLDDAYKEIAILIFREQGTQNPYQPFDASNCDQNNFNPITVKGDDIEFITPINGVLAGKAIDANVSDRMNHVQVQWKSENNQLIDYFEVQRKDNSGEFKTIGLVMGTDNSAEENYEYKDKVTVRDIESSYRIRVVGKDKMITYSSVQKIRLSSSQTLTVKVYPNPSSDAVRINLPEPNGIYVSRIYSTEGRMVLTGNVTSSNPSVNIKSLQTGSYFMELYHPKSGMRYYTQFNKQ